MRISRLKLRRLIENFVLREMNSDADIVNNLNTLIHDAKQREIEAREASEELYYDHPSDDYDQIEILVSSLGFNQNPPKELSIHYVVEAEDGEVLASYLTYDQAVEFGKRKRLIPVDGFGGKQVAIPVVADGRNIYFIETY